MEVEVNLDSIFSRPFSSGGLISGSVVFVDVGDFRNQRIIRVRIG